MAAGRRRPRGALQARAALAVSGTKLRPPLLFLKARFKRGLLSFAGAGANSRATEMFLAFKVPSAYYYYYLSSYYYYCVFSILTARPRLSRARKDIGLGGALHEVPFARVVDDGVGYATMDHW